MESNPNPDRIYWDSCVYLNFLRGGHPNADAMHAILRAWEAGEVILATSALTIAEVLHVRCEGLPASWIDKSKQGEILRLFTAREKGELVLVELTRPLAESARDLCWHHRVPPKDAVHIASALLDPAQTQPLYTTQSPLPVVR